MSIASEIARIHTAKADLKTSIEGKGVTVPANAKIDAYSALVDSIQTGGGLPQGMTHIGSGSFTFASRTVSTEKIYHGLDFTPRFVLLWTDDAQLAYNDVFYCVLPNGLTDNYGTKYSQRLIVYRTSSGPTLSSQMSSPVDENVKDSYFAIAHGSYYYKAGATYNWFAFA